VASKRSVRRYHGGNSLTRSWLLDDNRAAVLPREEPEAAGEDAVRGSQGVSDPVSAAPDFARRPAPMGSLTPRLRVSFVRTNVTARSSSTRHAT